MEPKKFDTEYRRNIHENLDMAMDRAEREGSFCWLGEFVNLVTSYNEIEAIAKAYGDWKQMGWIK